MLEKRIIPCLLISDDGLVKTTKFKNPSYIGDPINTVKIFNDKEVDELIILDIGASKKKRGPNFNLLSELADEAFMPMAYGGGLHEFDHISKVFEMGFEKVCLNSENFKDFGLLEKAASKFGSQSVVAAVDIKKNLLGRPLIYDHVAQRTLSIEPKVYLQNLVNSGAGEVFLTCTDKDGTLSGYDLKMMQNLIEGIKIPIIGNGGCKDLQDMKALLLSGFDAAAAGAFFVYHGPHKAVLVNYPKRQMIEDVFHEANI